MMNWKLISFISLIIGILFGIILTIGIKYPFDLKELETTKTICPVDQPAKRIKIGVTGKIYEVECTNSTIFRLN